MNDTIYHYQKFFSHFSYDDGSAESAYGINVSGAMGALQFKLNRPDTLRAVQIYFGMIEFLLSELLSICYLYSSRQACAPPRQQD